MPSDLRGQKCYLRVSEPFEYGYESNPDPLSLELLGSTKVDGKSQVILRGVIHSKGRLYRIGFANARYVGDDVVSLISNAKECIVNTSFVRQEDTNISVDRANIDEIVSACSAIPFDCRLLLIGDLRLA